MKRFFPLNLPLAAPCRAISLILLILALLTPISDIAAQEEAVPGQFIMKFASKTSTAFQQSTRSALGVRALSTSDLTKTQLVEMSAKKSFNTKLAKDLLAAGIIEYIEPNYIYSINKTPNDPSYSQLWGLNNSGGSNSTANIDIDGPEAWDINTGSSTVVVGVVDTGIDYTHPDLAANIWNNPFETANGIDDDNNGVIDDIHGYNAIGHSGNPMDDNGHGSHVSGTIGAVGNNRIGVTGVAWNVKLMALKFLNSAGSGTTQAAIDAINYAISMKNHGVNIRVLNNSWGGSGSSIALREAISAANAAGILFVAAAGNAANDNDASPTYPAGYDVDNVISVAALDSNGNLASFSNYGRTTVDVAAPGVGILSTTPGASYTRLDGTSMATPFVTGVAALVVSKTNSLSVGSVRSRILNTVKPLASLTGVIASPGIVSAKRALNNTQTELPDPGELAKYTKSKVTYSFDTSYGTKVQSKDDGYTVADLGFSFPFYGEGFSRVALSANGRIVPLRTGEAAPTTADFSNRISTGIIPYNEDLFPSPFSDGGIFFKQSADKATFTWVVVNYPHRNSQDSKSEVTFQVVLFSSGDIEFRYKDTKANDTLFDYGVSASVGIAPIPGLAGETLAVSHNTKNKAELGNGNALRFSSSDAAADYVHADYDGDSKSDLVVYRPTSGMWYILTSKSKFKFSSHKEYQLGLPGDLPLVGDFDGDSKADMAVWRPTDGNWFFRLSSDKYANITAIQWGLAGDIPLVGDYDGDKVSDLAVYRPLYGTFYVLLSSSGFNRTDAVSGFNSTSSIVSALGGIGHDPIVGDFTGNGKADFTTVWQSIRFWTVKDTDGNYIYSLPWGAAGDTPLGCKIDSDSMTDRVVVRAEANSQLKWYTITGEGKATVKTLGYLGDTPNCNGDYDGDGKGDMRAYRNATGEWIIKKSKATKLTKIKFGLPGDIPL